MLKTVIKGASIGLAFSAIAFGSVKLLGFNWTSLSFVMYLYVLLAVALVLRQEIGGGLLSSIVVVIEGEEMKLKKLLTGETYRIKGEIEKL